MGRPNGTRSPCGARSIDLVVGVVRRLGESIGVHQLDSGWTRTSADQLLLEGLARGHDVREIPELAWVLAR